MTDWLHQNILYILLLISVVISVFWMIHFQKELRARWYAMIVIAVLVVATGVAGAMLFAKLEGFIAGSSDGRISMYGALWLTPLVCVAAALLFRRPARAVLDILTLPIVCAAAFARVNCFFGGCCLGIEIPGAGFRVPNREIELVFYVVFMAVIARVTAKKRFKGVNYPIFLLCYGVLRFILQWFREGGYTVLGPLTLSHLWSLLSAAAGLVLLIVLSKTYKTSGKTVGKKKINRA